MPFNISSRAAASTPPGKNRVFASNTAVAPAIAGQPTVAEITTFASGISAVDTIIYYTGTNTSTDAITHAYWVDQAGVVTQLERPAAGTPGIDSVLAVAQTMTASRAITTGANTFAVTSTTGGMSITATTLGLRLVDRTPLRFGDADNSNFVALRAPTTIATDVTLTLPNADGVRGSSLVTDGSGNLSWRDDRGVTTAIVPVTATPVAIDFSDGSQVYYIRISNTSTGNVSIAYPSNLSADAYNFRLILENVDTVLRTVTFDSNYRRAGGGTVAAVTMGIGNSIVYEVFRTRSTPLDHWTLAVDSSRIVPDMFDASGSGYIDFGNMRMQWGVITGSATQETITFPAAFANTAYSITYGAYHNEGSGTDRRAFTTATVVNSKTTSGCQAHKRFVESDSTIANTGDVFDAVSENIDWIAIGLKP